MSTAIWTGAVSNDWTNPDNWSEGIVPDQDTDVIVNSDYSEIFIPEEVVVKSLTVENYSAYISLGGNLVCTDKFELTFGVGGINVNGNSIFCLSATITDGYDINLVGGGKFICCTLIVSYLEDASSSGTKDSVFIYDDSSELIVSLGQILNKLSEYIEISPEIWGEYYSVFPAVIMVYVDTEGSVFGSNIVPQFPNTVLQGKCVLIGLLNEKISFSSLSLQPDIILQNHVSGAINKLYLGTSDSEQQYYPSYLEVGEFRVSGQEGNLFNLLGSLPELEDTVSWSIEQESGIVEAQYANIANSTALGDAIFKALVNKGSIDGGNNEGWIFSETTVFSSIEITERTTESVKAAVEILEYDPATSKTPQILSLQGMLETYNLEQYGRVPFIVNYAKPDAEYRFDLLSELEETPDILEMVSMTEPYWSDGTSFVTDQIYFNPIYTGEYELVLFENDIEVDRVQISVEEGGT